MTSNNNFIFRVISILVLVVMLAAAIFMLVRQHWQGAIVLTVFFGLSLYVLLRGTKLPALFRMLFIFAVLANAAGYVWNLFDKLFLYDDLVHLYTGFAVTLALGYLLYSEVRKTFRFHRIMFLITITCVGVTLGVIWEVVEWLIEALLNKNMIGSATDTIGDLVLDSIGAFLAAVMNLRGLKNDAERPVK